MCLQIQCNYPFIALISHVRYTEDEVSVYSSSGLGRKIVVPNDNVYFVSPGAGKMADSDEEYDRHQRHDKFTRERREYQGGSSRGRREDWVDDDRSGGWNSGGHRGRDNYGRDHYGGYNRRDRHSPGRGDPSPPAKRMRGRDWDGDRGFGDGHGNNWGQGDHRQQSRYQMRSIVQQLIDEFV